MSRFLRAGALAGAAGGLVMAVILRLLGEGGISDAVDLEARMHHGREAVHDELYSRAIQQIGGMIGVLLYGIAMGVILAVVLAAVRHRLPMRDDWARSVTLAAIGFGTIVLVPFLKYPASPPTVGSPDTITRRTLLFLTFVAFSLVATFLSWRFAAAVSARWSRPVVVPATVLLHVTVIGVAFAVFPAFTDKVAVPATLLWRFRVASLGGQVGLWCVLGLTLGSLLLPRRSASASGPLVGSHG